MKYKRMALAACALLLLLSATNLSAVLTDEHPRYHQHLERPAYTPCAEHDGETLCTHLPLVLIDTGGAEIPGVPIRDGDGSRSNDTFTTTADGGTLLRAQTQAPDGDMRGAIDAAVGYIERQILKNKTRLAKRLRTEGFPPPAPADDFEVAEEKEFPIVRTKRFSVKPMSPEEAILQMNLLDHSFFVFRSSEDDGLSIVYRRKNGGYGLIVTDEEE